MTVNAHGDRKYHAVTSKLVGAVGLPNLRVEHRALQAGAQNPGTCESNEIAFVISGRTFGFQATNGPTRRAFIQPGIACICPVGTYERVSGVTSQIECLHLFLPQTLIEQSALADYEIDPARAELAYAGGLADPTLHNLGMTFQGILGQKLEPTDQLFYDGIQSALAAHLLGHYAIDRWKPPARTPDFDHRKLQRVLDLIDARSAENLALRELAAEACLSEFHFSRLFREATGFSPHRYVTHRRVEAAQHMLTQGNSSLTEIALETGFGSQANFIRSFRKVAGLTPGQYRKLHG